MKSITKTSIIKLLIALALSLSIVLSVTSITSARTVSFTIHKGWNLIGGEFLLRSSGALDKYVAFYYNPVDKTYHKFDGGFDSSYQEYTNNYVTADALTSFWIYNDGESFTTAVDFDNSQLKKAEIGLQKLKKGWNVISITNSMYYDDNGQPNNLSPNKIKGTCQIEKAFIYDASQQTWISWGTEVASFDDDTVGMGWVAKVANDCQLSVKADIPAPPSIPN